jgi:hypothetical protein
MSSETRRFEEYLALYGAELEIWPEEIREVYRQALTDNAEFRELIEKESRFEGIIRRRSFEFPSTDLEARIIAASRKARQSHSPGKGSFLMELFYEFSLGRRAAAFAGVLIIFVTLAGFAIGYKGVGETPLSPLYTVSMGEFLQYDGEVI